MFRGPQTRKLNAGLLWIAPAFIVTMIGLLISQQPPTNPVAMALDAAALALGASIGWWRGKLTKINYDPGKKSLTTQTSPTGVLLILGVTTLRYAMRSYGGEGAGLFRVSANDITDAILLLAVGLVCAQRIEMWVRARGLVARA